MSTPEETSAVEGVDNGKQGNTQTQGESNTCQTSVQRKTERNRLPENQSTNDQGNSTATHAEMWRERQGRTPDGGRQEGTRETVLTTHENGGRDVHTYKNSRWCAYA